MEFIPAIWPATLMGLVFLLVEIVFLPGGGSAFRLPKEALAVAGILAVLALGLSTRLRNAPLPVPRGALVATLMILPVLQLASILWAADSNRALATAAITATWIAGAIWLATLDPVQRGRVLTLTAVGAAISGVVLILQAAGVPLLVVGRSAGSRFRMSGLAGNPADFAMAAVLLLPLLLVSARKDRRSWWRWLMILILVIATVLSQTFTGAIALAGIALVWLIQQRSWKLWAGASAVAVLAITLAFATGLSGRVHRQIRLIQLGDTYSLLSARADGWTAATEMLRQRPVTGVGAGHYTHAYYPSRLEWLEARSAIGRRGELATHFEWAHCDPLQLVAELGISGALWLVALLWSGFRARPRGDPVMPLAFAAAAPFLLLHYPTHLAVGMMPIALILAHILAVQDRGTIPKLAGVWRVAVPVLLVAIATAGSLWQMRRVALDIWRANLERGVAFAASATEPVRRNQLASAVEWQVLERIQQLPEAAPVLWRVVGKARLARGDARAAEEAFRNANGLWPHEEAELGLGLALADQDRRSEAMVFLGRVCRTNPALTREITDPDLRRALEDLNRARRQAVGSRQ